MTDLIAIGSIYKDLGKRGYSVLFNAEGIVLVHNSGSNIIVPAGVLSAVWVNALYKDKAFAPQASLLFQRGLKAGGIAGAFPLVELRDGHTIAQNDATVVDAMLDRAQITTSQRLEGRPQYYPMGACDMSTFVDDEGDVRVPDGVYYCTMKEKAGTSKLLVSSLKGTESPMLTWHTDGVLTITNWSGALCDLPPPPGLFSVDLHAYEDGADQAGEDSKSTSGDWAEQVQQAEDAQEGAISAEEANCQAIVRKYKLALASTSQLLAFLSDVGTGRWFIRNNKDPAYPNGSNKRSLTGLLLVELQGQRLGCNELVHEISNYLGTDDQAYIVVMLKRMQGQLRISGDAFQF